VFQKKVELLRFNWFDKLRRLQSFALASNHLSDKAKRSGVRLLRRGNSEHVFQISKQD
jgi:hypothetical protein